MYEFSGVKVRDFPKGAVDLTPYLVREFSLEGEAKDGKLHYLAAAGQKIVQREDLYVVDDKYTVSFPDLKDTKVALRDSAGRKELLIPLKLDGKLSFVQRYRWQYE